MKRCKGYAGLACVNGNCPRALALEFPELFPESLFKDMTCDECAHYNGCDDCAFSGTELCYLIKDIK